MMKIYIIIGNNGEPYPEDYYEWVEGVYIAKGNAKKELKKLKAKANRDYKKEPFYEKRKYEMKEYVTKD